MLRGSTSDRDGILERAAGFGVVRDKGNNDILKTIKNDRCKTAFNAYRFSWLRHECGA
jgi:hypothetical protein